MTDKVADQTTEQKIDLTTTPDLKTAAPPGDNDPSISASNASAARKKLTDPRVAVRVTVFEDNAFHDVDVSEIPALLTEQKRLFWVDIVHPKDQDFNLLSDVFHFHPLAVEDTRNSLQRPKVDEYAGYLFILMNTARYHDGEVHFEEIDIFLSTHYLVTVRMHPERLLDDVRARLCDPESRIFIPSAGYLMYVLSDVVVDSYFAIVDQLGERIDVFEEKIVNNPRQDMLADIFQFKRTLTETWRVVTTQRDMFTVLLHREKYVEAKSLGLYFSDVYDHVLRIVDNVNAYRDISTSLVELFMSATSNRLNIVVNRLAVVTIVIGILTVISGFYGMNFERTWPAFTTPWGVPFVLGLMAALSVLAVVIMKRLKMF